MYPQLIAVHDATAALREALQRLRVAEGSAASVEREVVMRSVVRLTKIQGGRGIGHAVWSSPMLVKPCPDMIDDVVTAQPLSIHNDDDDVDDIFTSCFNLPAPGSERHVAAGRSCVTVCM